MLPILIDYTRKLLMVIAVLTISEWLYPIERQSMKSRVSGVLNRIWYTLWHALVLSVFTLIPIPNLTTIHLSHGVGLLLGVFIGDFFYYWFHRLEHTLPWLWKMHSFHHRYTELNCLNSVNHPFELPLQLLFVAVPAALLTKIVDPTGGVLPVLFFGWEFFVHSNVRVNLPWVDRWLGTPKVHRIHHSCEPQHYDRNFAAFFPVIDRVFGTYQACKYFPRTGL